MSLSHQTGKMKTLEMQNELQRRKESYLYNLALMKVRAGLELSEEEKAVLARHKYRR